MKKKHENKMQLIRVEPRAMLPVTNDESALNGTAQLAQNLRECEQSLQVTGQPAVTGTIDVGDRLLTVSDSHKVTCHERVVKIDGVPVMTATSEVVGAQVIGDLMVIVTRNGLTYLARPGDDGPWVVMNPADAVPQLSFTAQCATSQANIAPYSFETPYQQWRAPLADMDTTALLGLLRVAWNGLNADAHAEGRRTAPILVRWAVRLHDDSYLWVSDPVRVGDETLSNADRVSAIIDYDNSGFTGTQATSMTLTHYTLGIAVVQGIAAQWLPLVKSIDVLATDEARLLNASRALDYRCITRTTGPREYVLEMGLSWRGAAAIAHDLASSPWRLIATAPASAQMSGNDFDTPVETLAMSAAQCADLARPLEVSDIVCMTTAGGRLFLCTRAGSVVVSAPGNALVEAHRRNVMGVVPLAMAVVTRPLYSSGFGRYPVYVFSDDGIYAIPQSGATGALGEARLVDRTVIAADVAPVEADGDVWLISRHRQLCCLSGSRLSVRQSDVDCSSMAWCNAYRELWLLPADGFPVVMMPSGRMCCRTMTINAFYSDPRHALALNTAGQVMDLEQEQPAMMPVAWHSHPVALDPLMARAVKRVVWHVSGDEVSLTLRVTGQRGIMAQEIEVSLITVVGAVNQPLATPTMALHARSLTLSLDGEARTGTLLLPSLIYHT